MSLIVTPGYTWVNGEVETATKLNLAASPTIADGQAGVFSTITATVGATVGANAAAGYTSLTINGASGGSVQIQKAGTNYGILYGDNTNTVLDSGTSANLVLATGGVTRGAFTPSGLAVTGAISATTDLSVGGIITYSGGLKIVPSDFVASSSTLTNVTGLLVNVLNGGVYRYVVASPLSQAGGGGYKVGLGGTATIGAGASIYQYLTTTVANSVQGNLGTGTVFSNANITASQSASFLWHGTFTATGSGTVTIQFAQNSSTSSSTFPAGSYFEVVRIS